YESAWDVDLVGDDSGELLLAVENADGYSRLQLIGREEVPLPGRGVVEHPVFSPDGSRLAFGFSSPVEPHDVYVYDLESRELERLTTSPRDVDVAALVEPELHRFESFDGESI